MSAASSSSSNSSPDLSSLSSATASVPIRSMTDVPVDGSDAPISPFSSAVLSLAHDDQQNYHQQPRPKIGGGKNAGGQQQSTVGRPSPSVSRAALFQMAPVAPLRSPSLQPSLSARHDVFLLSVLAIVLVVCLAIVVVVSSAQWHQINEEDAAFLTGKSAGDQTVSENAMPSEGRQKRFDVPPLILISMDGFRADFLQRGKTEAVSRIIQCGASTEFMMPSYPSKTFPNHFTIATGLYPESHGIVDNYFYDEEMPAEEKNFTRSSRNPAWYKGEPIWNTVAKNGKMSGIFFWPGSEVPIQGIRPTYRYSYNASIPFSKRVDQVIKWLRLDENERPAFLAMYFEQPDSAMHQEGPDSDAVNSALIYVDAMINYLMQQLDNNGFLGCINLIIVSDHGAQKLRDDMAVTLDRFVDMADPGSRRSFPGNHETLLNKVLAPFECSGGQIFRVYTRETMPRRYHYARSGRIGELVIDSAVGTKLFKTAEKMNASKMKGGARGTGRSPSRNIELYNLFTALMQLTVTGVYASQMSLYSLSFFFAPNNGTLGRLNSLLRSPPNADAEPMAELAECAGAQLVKCGDGCHFELHYSGRPFGTVSLPSAPPSAPTSSRPDASSASADQSEGFSAPDHQSANLFCSAFKYAEHLLMPELLQQHVPMCVLRLCNATMVFNLHRQAPLFVESQLTAPVPSIDHRLVHLASFVSL
ncbi:hypothetical protein niasHT_011889 [Heterodera trifolii]|uniref:Uncharacterized protein n=1 Tax=Heterodera trifolii TaxID=157864 RepID=A0ABD2KX21_9BILA